jgi:hypothetical protein
MTSKVSVRIRIVSFALLAVCGLPSPVKASTNDLQSGDLLSGVAVAAGFGNLGNSAIPLVRNRAMSVFCESMSNSTAPNCFCVPTDYAFTGCMGGFAPNCGIARKAGQ